jgi:CheY-like chemotaxis protein
VPESPGLHVTVADADPQSLNVFPSSEIATAHVVMPAESPLHVSSYSAPAIAGRIGPASEPCDGRELLVNSPYRRTAGVGGRDLPIPAMRGLRTLVVDADVNSRHVLQELLRARGMVASSARSGAEAVAKLERAMAADLPYGLVFLDAALLEGDGLEAAEWIRNRPELTETEIIPVTSLARPQDLGRCRQVGLTAILVKPVVSVELLEVVRATLEARRRCRPKPKRASTACVLKSGLRARIVLAEANAQGAGSAESPCGAPEGVVKN